MLTIRITLSRKMGELRITRKQLAAMTGIRENTIGNYYNEYAPNRDAESINDAIYIEHSSDAKDKMMAQLKTHAYTDGEPVDVGYIHVTSVDEQGKSHKLYLGYIPVVFGGEIKAVMGNTSFMWKVLRLLMEFFTQRMTGDIVQRQSTNASIAGTIVSTLSPLALNTVMMFVYLVFMLRFSPLMTAVGLGTVFLTLLIARQMSKKRVNMTRVQMRDRSKLASATIAGISMTETIKATGAENGFFQKWAGYQASVNTADRKFERMNARFGIIPTFIGKTANYLVMFLGVQYAMRGSFTLGMITIFQGYMGAFLSPRHDPDRRRPDHPGNEDPDGAGGGRDAVSGRSLRPGRGDPGRRGLFQAVRAGGTKEHHVRILQAGKALDPGLFHDAEARKPGSVRRRERMREKHPVQADLRAV